MGSTDVTVEDLLEDLCDALDNATSPTRPEGEGWFTLPEITEKKGWGRDRVRANLERLIERKQAEKTKVGVVNFFRLIK